MKSKLLKIISLFLKYAIGLAALVYLFRTTSFTFSDLHPLFTFQHLFVLISIKLITFVVISLRWDMVLRSFGLRTSLRELLRSNIISISMSYFLPGSITADFGRGLLLARSEPVVHRKIIMASAFIDRIIGLITLLFISLMSFAVMFFRGENRFDALIKQINIQPNKIVIVLLIFLVLLILWKPWKMKMNFFNLLKKIEYKLFSKVFILSIFSNLLYIAYIAYVGIVLDLPQVTFLSALIVVPPASVLLVIPLTPGGVGVGQWIFNYMFNMYSGFDSVDGSLAFTSNQMGDLVLVLLGLFAFLLRPNMSRTNHEA